MPKALTGIFFLFAAVFAASVTHALDTETLPQGVRTTQTRFGFISGLDNTWGADSNLYDLGDYRSISFDAMTLARIDLRAQRLINALNSIGRQDLGTKINLGTLNVHTKPEIMYFAPVLAYGVTPKLTVGLGVPVINYRNRMSLSSSGSNVDFYRTQLDNISAELDSVVNIDITVEAQQMIAQKGYKPLSNRNESFIGDLQLGSMYRLPDLGSWSFMHQLFLTLPTGPKDDADDLMAINAFGRTYIDNTLVAARPLWGNWLYVPYATALLPIPDQVVKRVPRNEEDTLPDVDSKQEVLRITGPTGTLGNELHWTLAERWSLKGGLEASWKAHDRYVGNGRIDLLARNSSSFAARSRGGVTYSTVESYKRGRAMIPSRIMLELSDTFAGRNIERQLRSELSAMIFF